MYNRILVALDVLEPAVFETALSVAGATEADLLLLHVLSEHDADSPPSPISIIWDYATPLSEEAWNNYQTQWKAYTNQSLGVLRDYTGRAEAAGITADFLQLTNEPGKGICKAAKDWSANLIVIGSHQRKGLKELLLGSVSNYVRHHASCSVMVVALESERQHEWAEKHFAASVPAS